MAVNLTPPSQLLAVPGIRLAAVTANIYKKPRPDLVIMELVEGSQTAAVFTTNAFCAAPVTLCKEHLELTQPRYLLINAGNANAGTGKQGMQAARETCELLAQQTQCHTEQVLPFSTGVIGQQMPVEKFATAIPQALAALSADNWMSVAQGIMTTDTIAKGVSSQIEIEGKTVTITGIAKGSGMIKPDMATMLSYVATDAEIEQGLLVKILKEAVTGSFNSITVDSDTSTNDSLVLVATGKSGVKINSKNLRTLQEAVNDVCQTLAQAIIRDGEGATKFITIDVIEAKSVEEARQVAYSVAHSPLVKTAMFASDPNWGRLLMAIGKSKVEALDVNKISIWLGDTLLLDEGEPAASYSEERGQQELNKEEIDVRIYLDRGDAMTRIWTSDLSHEYVRINAEYRS